MTNLDKLNAAVARIQKEVTEAVELLRASGTDQTAIDAIADKLEAAATALDEFTPDTPTV